jgi:hypothetical protein
MEARDSMAIPSLYYLGDLSKEDDQMIIILHAVQFHSAYAAILRSQAGVSLLLYIISYRDIVDCRFFIFTNLVLQ